MVMVLMSLLLLDGCNIIRKTVTRKGSMAEGESLVRKVTGSQPDWNFIELRVTGKAEEDKTRFAFMGSVKIHHNSKIFIILRSTLGFEVARFYADMDSVWILSKMLDIKEKGNWKLVGAKVVPVITRLTAQGYDVEVGEPWVNFPSDDAQADTARMNELLAQYIAVDPAQYYWVHKRFKTRPEGEPGLY